MCRDQYINFLFELQMFPYRGYDFEYKSFISKVFKEIAKIPPYRYTFFLTD